MVVDFTSAACPEEAPHRPHNWGTDGTFYRCHGHTFPAFQGTDDLAQQSPGLDRILAIIEEFRAHITEAYLEYGEGAADDLGLPGEWSQLWRKVRKLKAPLWEGRKQLTREGEREILLDMMGHAVLSIDMLDRGMEGGRSAVDSN